MRVDESQLSLPGNQEAVNQGDSAFNIFGLSGELRSTLAVSGPVALGFEYDTGLPYANVIPDNDNLVFNPNWDGEENADPAYAIWAFNINGYPTEGKITFQWADNTDNLADVWIGIPDYSRATWTWQDITEPEMQSSFDSETAITNQGLLFVAVVVLGTAQWELEQLAVGINPDAPRILAVTPTSGATGQPAEFDSQTSQGEATSWLWDFGSAGTPTTSMDSNPVVNLGNSGEYECYVTASNDFGSSRFHFSFEVHQWNSGDIYMTHGKGIPGAMVLDSAGFPHICLYDNSTKDLIYEHWNGEYWDYEIVDNQGDVGRSSDLTLDSNGFPHISYYDSDNSSLKYAFWDGTGWQIEVVVDQVTWSYRNPIRMDSTGVPYIAYIGYESQPSGNVLFLKLASTETGVWDAKTVANLERNNGHPAMAIDQLGNPHISYISGPNPNLNYASNDGLEWTISTVDEYIGERAMSLALDSSDQPHISYQGAVDKEIKYAFIDESNWVLESVDSQGSIGGSSSIAIDWEDRVYISYYSYFGEGDLRYAYQDGGNWHNEIIDDCGSVTDTLSTIAIDNSGLPNVIYRFDPPWVHNAYWIKHASISDSITYPPRVVNVKYVDDHSNYPARFSVDSACQPELYFWEFGDAAIPNTSTGGVTTVTLGPPGTYDCSVTASNPDGSHTFYFTVEPDDWEFHEVATSADMVQNNSLALDAAGNVHICFFDEVNESLKYAIGDGNTWQVETVDANGRVGRSCSLALDSNGNPHISYYEDWLNENLKYASLENGTWTIQTVDSEGRVGAYSSIAIDSFDFPNISYKDFTNYNLKHTRWNGLGWEIETVDNDPVCGSYCSMALDNLDHPHISYHSEFSLKYAHWNGSNWQLEQLDYLAGSANDTSLVVGEDFQVYISYDRFNPDDLRCAHWDGSEWSFATVDSDGRVGHRNSIALDSTGRPHIAYYDFTRDGLRYAFWDGFDWQVDQVSELGRTGSYNSLALDSSDNPHFSMSSSIVESGLSYIHKLLP